MIELPDGFRWGYPVVGAPGKPKIRHVIFHGLVTGTYYRLCDGRRADICLFVWSEPSVCEVCMFKLAEWIVGVR